MMQVSPLRPDSNGLSILFELRERARLLPETDGAKAFLKELAGGLQSAMRDLTASPTHDNMQRLNGLWVRSCRALNDHPVPEAPTPLGGAMRMDKSHDEGLRERRAA